MTVNLDLPEKLIEELSAEASRLGLPLSEYASHLLSLGRKQSTSPKTGAELVAYWQREGLLGTRPDIGDSAEYARELRRQAENRNRS